MAEKYLLSEETAEKLRRIIDAQDGTEWDNTQGTQDRHVALVKCGDFKLNVNGTNLYKGTIQLVLGNDLSADTADLTCYLGEVQKLPLTPGNIYIAMRVGDYSDGTTVYLTSCGCGGSASSSSSSSSSSSASASSASASSASSSSPPRVVTSVACTSGSGSGGNSLAVTTSAISATVTVNGVSYPVTITLT